MLQTALSPLTALSAVCDARKFFLQNAEFAYDSNPIHCENPILNIIYSHNILILRLKP